MAATMKSIFLRITDELTGKICRNIFSKGKVAIPWWWVISRIIALQWNITFTFVVSSEDEPKAGIVSGGLGGLIGYGKLSRSRDRRLRKIQDQNQTRMTMTNQMTRTTIAMHRYPPKCCEKNAKISKKYKNVDLKCSVKNEVGSRIMINEGRPEVVIF